MLKVKGLKPLVELLALNTELASGINLKLHCYITLEDMVHEFFWLKWVMQAFNLLFPHTHLIEHYELT